MNASPYNILVKGASRRLRGAEPGAEDDSTCEPSQFIEGERPRPQGSSPVEEYPEKYTDSDKEGEVERDPLQKKSGKKGKRLGLFDKSSTPKMSKLKEVPSPESGVIVKTAKDGGAEGLVFSGGGKEGIFIKEVVPESPASKSLSVKEGDQILSATVYFDNVTYEDAIQILEHAQAYKVKLCLKRTPDITESEPVIQSEVIPEGEVFSPEMRGQGKAKRHDARISWPKFPSFGKGRKSHFTRSHSSSEADEQRKLELSPTTSDTESPIKSQEALKGKKKHKVKIPVLRKKGRKSSSEDQDTPGPLYGVEVLQTQIASDIHSPECLESPSGETLQVCVAADLEVRDASNIILEQNDQKVTEPETVQHKVELISLDSTLKTTDLTVALADQESPSGVKSPDGKKKKKKERSELKLRIMGKDKSHKQDAKAKSSPKRLQTLGASIEITDAKKMEKSADIPSVVSHMEQEGRQKALDTNTQVISAKSLPTQMEISVPKVDLSLDTPDVGLIKKSPQRGKEKTKKDTPKLSMDIKQKTDTKTGASIKLPKVDSTDIALEEPIRQIDINVEKDTTKTKHLTMEGTGMKQEKSSLPKTQLPKREDIEIPGMEDITMGTTTQGIKEPKVVFTGQEIQAETVQMAIDVDSVKEAVSKLPGFKLPQVDTSGVLIPEEITVIDANAQRISVKTHGTPTKVLDVQTKQESYFDIKASPEISRTSVKLPKIKLPDLRSHELISETKVADKKIKMEYRAMANQSEIKIGLNKREDIIIPGKESTHEAANLQAEEIEGIQCAYESEDKMVMLSSEGSDKKSKKVKITMPSFEIAKPDIKFPDIGIDLPKQSLTEQKGDTERSRLLQEMKTSKTEPRLSEDTSSKFEISMPKVKGPGLDLRLSKTEDVTLPEVALPDVELKQSLAKVDEGITVDVTEPSIDIKVPSIDVKSAAIEVEGKGSPFKMPNIGISMPKVKGPEIDLGLSKKDRDVQLPEAEVKIPDIEVKETSAAISMPETSTPAKFKRPRFTLPKFSFSKSSVKEPEMKVSLSDVDVALPQVKVEAKKPEAEIKAPEAEVEFGMQGSKFNIPKLRGPEIDLSLTKKNIDVRLPEAEVHLPDIEVKGPPSKVEMKAPHIELQVKDAEGSPSKLKMPTVKLPQFGVASPNITVEVPYMDKDIKTGEADIKLPKEGATVDIMAPRIGIEGPSIHVKTTGTELEGKGNKFKMPNLGLSMPKVKGPQIDFSSSKKDVEVTLPEAKAEVKLPEAPEIDVNLPKVDVSIPEGKLKVKKPEVEIKVPETELELDGQQSKFKMPNLGLSMPKVKGPQIDFSLSKKDVEVTLPEAKAEVKLPEAPEIDVNLPKVDVSIPEGKLKVKKPEVEIKAPETELELDGQQSKFKMPKFGISLPKVKGPEVDWSSSKKDVDIPFPEAEADVHLPDIELKEGGAKVDVKAPEIAVHPKDVEGSPYKFKMPTFKMPKFGASSPSITVEVPDMDKDTKMYEADGKIPKEGVTIDITAPSMPKVKRPEIDLSLSKKDVDVTLPEAKAKVKLTGVEVKEPSGGILIEEQPGVQIDAKLKKPRFSLPRFSFSKPSVKELEADVSPLDVDVALPEGKVVVKQPEVEIKPPESEVEFDGQGSKFKMPKFGISLPKVTGPEFDLSLSKKDVDITLPEAKAEVHLPDVKLKEPSAKVEIKAPEVDVQVKDAEGSPSKFKMPTFKLPRFGAATPNVIVEVPELDKEMNIDGAELKIPKEELAVDITTPSIDIEGPSVDVKTTGTELEGKGNKFKMPNLGLSMPKVKGPQIDFSSSKKDVEVTLPEAKAKVKLPEAPEIDVNLPKVDVSIPEGKLKVKKPEVEIKAPETELELDGQQSKFKMPKFGISLPKVKGPEVDWSSSKKDVDIPFPEAEADIHLPDIELKEGGVKVDVKAPEIAVHPKDVEGSPYKFKMPTFKLPTFGASSPRITVEVPDVDKDVKMDEADMKIPKEGATIDITAPSIGIDVKTLETEVEGKGGKFKMPSLDLTMPKVKGPEIDLSLSKKDVDVTLPEAKAKVKLTGVEVKEPSGDILMEEQSGVQIDAKLKKPRFSLPRFSFSKPSVKEPEADVSPLDVDVALPEGKVVVKQPEVEIKPPESEVEFDGQGNKFKMPKFGISLPKVTGPEFDLSLSKKDVDITLPEAKAEVHLPDVKLKEPSAKVDIKAPEVDVQVKDTEGSPSKFKMPTFKLPRFGAATPNVIVEVPELDKEMNIDGAELKIPKEELAVDITAPSIDIEGPSVDVKTTGTEIEGKGNKFKMPKFGISLPKVTGPEFDLSLSKKDVDITLPEAKAGVQLPDVKIKEPSAKVDIKAPEVDVQVKDTEGSPSKFKMPTFKLPRFGAATPNVTAEVPELAKEISIDGAELKIPKEELAVDITTPSIDIEGPSLDVKTTGTESAVSVPDAPTIEVDAKLKKPSWTFPKISFSKPSIKAPDVDVNIEAPDVDVNIKAPEVDVTLPEIKTEVHIPDVEVKEPSAAISMKEPPTAELDAKLKKPMFSLPSFSFSKPSVKEPEINVDLPHVDASPPQGKLEVKKPEVEIKVPELESEHVGQGSKFKMPTFGISLPKVKGPEVDLGASKKDVHVTLSEAKPEVQFPNVEAKKPFAQVEVKAPEIEAQLKDLEGSPSKFKMPTFKMPKFGAATPNITVEVPDVDNKIEIDGAQPTIRKEGATMDISMPKVKGPEINLGLTKKGVGVTLPETKAEVKGTSATIAVPDVPTIEVDEKLKKPSWSLPKFSFSKPSIKAPDVDVNIEAPEVDVTLPETKTEIHLPDVDVKAPSGTLSMEEPPPVDIEVDAKLKKPMFSLPKFAFSKPTVKEPEAEVNISEVDAKQPHVEIKATEIEAELDGQGNKFKMPKFGISLPKVKGPDIDLSLSKKDVDITLPEAKAGVQLPDVKIKEPSAKVEIKAPEVEVQVKDTEGSPSKFKMPTFKLPKFGVSSPNITAEVPDMDKDIKIEGAHMKIPEGVVDITAPSIGLEAPSVDVNTTGVEGKGNKFKMPNLGISMPKDKGPEIDLSLSKKDIEVTLPETKAEVKKFSLPRFSFSKQNVKETEINVNLAEVDVSLPEGKMEVKEPEVEIKPPEAEVHLKDVQGSPSKFKMPTFKLPKFGIATPDVTVEVPEPDKEMNIDGAELKIPKGEAAADITTPSIGIEVPTTDEMKVPDVEVREPSATISEAPTIELKKPRFSLPKFSFSKTTVKEPEVDINLPRVNDTPEVKVEVEQTKAEIQAPASQVQLKDFEGSPSSVDIKANEPETSALDSEAPKTEIDSEVQGSPSKFKLPSFKMPRLSFSKSKPEDEYIRGDTESEHNQAEIEVEPQGLGKSSKLTLTSFGEILKTIDVEFDVPTKEEVEEKLTPSKEVCGPDELNVQNIAEKEDEMTEIKTKPKFTFPRLSFSRSPEETETVDSTNAKESKEKDSVKSPERAGWLKFPKFGLSSPPEKEEHESEKSPEEDVSTTCSVRSSDAFADISSTVTSEQVGLSLSSPTKVTVKYSDPNAKMGLGELHGNVISSTTRTGLISVEPNLPEKITILSSGGSSSSIDTLKLESGKIHVITSNIQATPEAQHATLLTDFQVQSAGGLQTGKRTVVQRQVVRETTSENRGTVVMTKRVTHVFGVDPAEPISDETASSIQRLRDTVHSEKMRFFDGAKK